jgi:hypothetical protein
MTSTNDMSKSYEQILNENRELVLIAAGYYAEIFQVKPEQAVIEVRRILAEKMKKWDKL